MTATPRNCRVLVAGEYYCDLVFSGLDGAPRLGAEDYASDLAIMPGGTYTMALALTRLGVETRWAAHFGTDLFSRFVLDAARDDGLDPAAFTLEPFPVQRVSAVFSAGSERGFISYSQPPVIPPAPAIAEAQSPEWLLQTFRYEPEWLAFMAAMRARGARIFADCRGGDFTVDTPGVRDFLALTEVFSPNLAEACTLAATDDADHAIALLAPLVPVLLVKCGPDGARLVAEGHDHRIPAPPAAVIDTVGAGDAFNAGYLFAVLGGLDPLAAARVAVLCGTLSTEATGGRGCPTLNELAAYARQSGRPLEDCLMDRIARNQRASIPREPIMTSKGTH